MRRGFKARSEQISKKFRETLSVDMDEELPFDLLAKHLNVLLYEITALPHLSESDITQLVEIDCDEWSAFTVSFRKRFLVVINPNHTRRRQANDVMHELSHIILGHEGNEIVPVPAEGLHLFSGFDPDDEEEATWLAAALLLPRQGLLTTFRKNQDISVIAGRFGVSTQLVNMRINRTGIRNQLKRY